jgi:chromate transporter
VIFGALPFWDRLRGWTGFRRALTSTNATVIGILAAALYTPVWTSAITAPVDVGIAAVALAMLLTARVPPLVVVAFCAVVGQLVSA